MLVDNIPHSHPTMFVASVLYVVVKGWLLVLATVNIEYHIQENIHRGKFSCFEWKIAIHGKTYFCRFVLLIDKAMIDSQENIRG